MNPKQLVAKFSDWFDARPSAEKVILVVLGFGGVTYLYLTIVFDPTRAEIDGLERQISTGTSRISEQEARTEELRLSGVEDPDAFVKARLEELILELSEAQAGIEALAGNLVSPNAMTQVLTSVLDSQPGLKLVRVENSDPEPLTGTSTVDQVLADASDAVAPSLGLQVYRHRLVLEFQGDYFSTLRYLLFLESMDENFFWDSVTYRQLEWPEARVQLELHTLSSEEGFIGV
jgi:MSHA biogenesis protein MshJ